MRPLRADKGHLMINYPMGDGLAFKVATCAEALTSRLPLDNFIYLHLPKSWLRGGESFLLFRLSPKKATLLRRQSEKQTNFELR